MFTKSIMNLCDSIFVFFIDIIDNEKKQHRYSHLLINCCGTSGTINVYKVENSVKRLLSLHKFASAACGETLKFELIIEPDDSIMIGNLLYSDNNDTFNTHRSYYINMDQKNISFDYILMYSWTDEMPYGIYEIVSLNNWQAT